MSDADSINAAGLARMRRATTVQFGCENLTARLQSEISR